MALIGVEELVQQRVAEERKRLEREWMPITSES